MNIRAFCFKNKVYILSGNATEGMLMQKFTISKLKLIFEDDMDHMKSRLCVHFLITSSDLLSYQEWISIRLDKLRNQDFTHLQNSTIKRAMMVVFHMITEFYVCLLPLPTCLQNNVQIYLKTVPEFRAF